MGGTCPRRRAGRTARSTLRRHWPDARVVARDAVRAPIREAHDVPAGSDAHQDYGERPTRIRKDRYCSAGRATSGHPGGWTEPF